MLADRFGQCVHISGNVLAGQAFDLKLAVLFDHVQMQRISESRAAQKMNGCNLIGIPGLSQAADIANTFFSKFGCDALIEKIPPLCFSSKTPEY